MLHFPKAERIGREISKKKNNSGPKNKNAKIMSGNSNSISNSKLHGWFITGFLLKTNNQNPR